MKRNPKKDKQDLEFEIKFYERIIRESPNFIQALAVLAEDFTKNGQYTKGLEIDKRLSRLKPEDAVVFYNLSCSYSLVGDIDSSLCALKQAIKFGYDDFGYMDKDSDLANLRKDKRYQQIISESIKSDSK